ncbi:MAG: L,D-transpeptidase family protein [Methyloceanibacter sp.]|uniref:L,D-transpeptidase family protein n=1 Tax=Methyloceanibacter sp. TaxID=1965321 RepID=UPI003D6D3549
MRGRSLVAILGVAGAGALAVAVAVWFVGRLPETATVVVNIPDNPAALAATEAQEAEVVAALPNAADEMPAEDAAPPEPSGPQPVFIADAVRAQMSNPALRAGAHPDDIAAVETFYTGHTGPALWVTDAGFTPQAQAIIAEIAKADDWGLESSAFAPPPADFQPADAGQQAAAELALDLAILKYARYARGGRANPSALSKIVDQTPPLRNPATVLTEIAAAPEPDAYLRDLHPKHEHFERLRQALVKARANSAKQEDVTRILINMERWRWMPENLGSLYVWLNTPEFMMYVVKDGKPIHSAKIVVGKVRYATPVFTANMTTIVFNPEWTVPPTIVREDLLPKLRGGGGLFSSNTAILKQHGLRVKYNGRPVDPGGIDWKSVNMAAISFHQAPGPTNVLGKVKFVYPNKHIVYMHDTIKRDLLNKTVRAEGHNCPRVDNPGKVAAVLLAEDKGWPTSKVEELLAKGHDASVSLDRQIPVHTTYFTAVADADGKVRTFADLYGLDRAVGNAIIGKGAAVNAVAGAPPSPLPKPNAGSVATTVP